MQCNCTAIGLCRELQINQGRQRNCTVYGWKARQSPPEWGLGAKSFRSPEKGGLISREWATGLLRTNQFWFFQSGATNRTLCFCSMICLITCRRFPIFPEPFVGGASTRLRGHCSEIACLLPGSVCPAHALLSARASWTEPTLRGTLLE